MQEILSVLKKQLKNLKKNKQVLSPWKIYKLNPIKTIFIKKRSSVMSMTDKVALITGAGRGIGKVIALTLAKEGANIIVNDIDRAATESTAKVIQAMGRKVITDSANIAIRSEVDTMCENIQQEFGKLDILINNAGITRDALLLKMKDEQWNSVIDVNLTGVFYCIQASLSLMKKQEGGRIINMTSASAQMGNIGQVNYAASKAGIIGMTKTLAKELARYQITVNAVAPGFIDTPMTEKIPDKVRNQLLSTIPLKRAGKPEDVANLVKFLSSSDSDYITGQIIACNGGMYL
jgi:3-oxoacyl-[acyl-carrier protein] reductase